MPKVPRSGDCASRRRAKKRGRTSGDGGERVLRGLYLVREPCDAEKGKTVAMVLCMVLHCVSAAHDVPAQLRIARRFFADAKKSSVRSVTIQDIQHLRRDVGIGAIVDGERDFVVCRGGGRQTYTVGAQPTAARPHAGECEQRVIGEQRAQHPTPQ